MKTNLLTCLLLCSALSMQAQDFRAVPPAEQPNAAELAYFGGKNPNLLVTPASDSGAIELVTGFLNDLSSNQLEAARNRMTDDFRAYSPDFDDYVTADNLLRRCERDQYLFTNQKLTINTIKSITVQAGDRRGQWVFVKAIWSAEDGRQQGKTIQSTYQELFYLINNQIDRTYISYGNDQIFYDLGFPLYAEPSSATPGR